MYIFYHDNTFQEIAYKGLIKNNKKEGGWTFYHPNGEICSKRYFKNDVLHGKCYRYTTYGKLVTRANYVNGKLEGQRKTYYEYRNSRHRYKMVNAQVGTFNYTNNKLDGSANYWTCDKNINVICNYKNGRLHGRAIYKNSFEEILKIEEYENGKKLSETIYENKSNHTTYSILIPHGSSPEVVKESMEKLYHCPNLHRLTIINYSKDRVIDSLIQNLIYPIAYMKHLSYIELKGTRFSKIPPSVFKCTNLKTLVLVELRLNQLPKEILNLTELTSLYLRYIKFPNPENTVKTISKISSLREFEFLDCFEVFPQNIKLLKQIDALYFAGMRRCSYELNDGLFELSNLKAINACHCHYYKYKEEFAKFLPYCTQIKIEICFAKNTEVTMFNKTKKSIELIKKGDVVIAYDVVNDIIDTATVTALHHHSDASYTMISILLNDSAKTKIICTGNHPFWTSLNSWTNADKLNIGDNLYIFDPNLKIIKQITIKEIRSERAVSEVFNISTTKGNYFANNILVHNK
ncbi:MAG: hypothetical protein IIA45_07110 [Bacteroidetes bacterium]|nr:hypothetical protein [Bacteroidota bacterium]